MPSQDLPEDVLATRFGAVSQGDANVSEVVDKRRPINIRLLDKNVEFRPSITPRGYQVELFKIALEKNVIIYLGTGLGKTFIIVLFLNSPHIDCQIQQGRKVVFLAPTQDLVQQQAEYVYGKVPYKVRVYCGRTCQTGKHIDKWKDEEWVTQLAEIDLLFMTPQIFSNAIVSGFIKWSNFSAVIFDEVHHCYSPKRGDSGHPYSKALEHYAFWFKQNSEEPRPRLIGLTASLFNNAQKDLHMVSNGVTQLERKIDGKCITSNDGIDTKPLMIVHVHAKVEVDRKNDIICEILSSYADQMKETMGITDKKRAFILNHGIEPSDDAERDFLAYHERLKLASSGISIKPNSFHKVLRQLCLVRQSSGLWTLANICHLLVGTLGKHAESRCVPDPIKPLYRDFSAILREILIALNDFLGSNWTNILLEFSQPKLLALLEILKKEYGRIQSGNTDKSTFSCIVFIRSRIEVLAIYNWLNQVSANMNEYSFLRVGYAIGMSATAASKWACITKRRTIDQANMLDSFRKQELNVIITTSVLEEGIDLPVCSTVIRFNPANDFRTYIQSRGRARQLRSSFISLADSDNSEQVVKDLKSYNLSDTQIKNVLSFKDVERFVPRPPRPAGQSERPTCLDMDEVFEMPGVRIDSITASTLINRYCAYLSRHCPFSSGIKYRRFQPRPDTFQTSLMLPIGCPVKHEIFGNIKSSIDLANRSAMIAALKALHEAGELNERGVPIAASDEKTSEILRRYNLEPDLSPINNPDEKVTEQEGREFYHYTWKGCSLELIDRMKFSVGRSCKLVKCVFQPTSDNQTRLDTESFFTSSRFGIIMDTSRECDLLPSKIYSHYGEFNVHYEVINNNLQLNSHQAHNDFFLYTFRLIQNCLGLARMHKAKFSERCLFYFVPLDSNNKIDLERVRNSFMIRSGQRLRENDVVKLERIFRSHSVDGQKLFLVKRIHTNMNAHSRVPGPRALTFIEHALEAYGFRISDSNQPVVEVVPISREFAKYHQGKKIRRTHTSNSLFYLYQFLDFFDQDPATIFQAFNLPPIVYRLYLGALCCELNSRFVSASSSWRQSVILSVPNDSSEPIVHKLDQEEEHTMQMDDCGGTTNEPSNIADQQGGDAILGASGNESSDDSSEFDDDSSFFDSDNDDDFDSSDGDDDADGTTTRRRLVVNEKTSDEWRQFEESVLNDSQLVIQKEHSYFCQKYVDTNPNYYSSFGQLHQRADPYLTRILKGLSELKLMLSGNLFLGDENILIREGICVDKSIKPAENFDRITGAVGRMSESGLCEALTQRRATEEFNLEGLENIGDAFLKYCTSVVLFKTLKGRDEGALTSARMRLVSNKHFTHLARRNALGSYAIGNKFSDKSLLSILGAAEPIKNKMRAKDLADTVESLVGAYLVNCGAFEAILAIDWLGLKMISREMFFEFHERAVVFSKAPSAFIDTELADPAHVELYNLNKKRLERFEHILNYKFNDASYLLQAVTHPSAPQSITDSYERLEFLGDAILDFLVTFTLYKAGFTKDPGQLTMSRSALVNNCAFAKLAFTYRYDIFLVHADQQLMDLLNKANDLLADDSDMEHLDNPEFDRITKLVADVFEAVAGAIYLDSGCSLDSVWSIYYPIMKTAIDKEIANPTKNPVMQVYEKYPERVTFKFERTALDVCFQASCVIEGAGEYLGVGMTKNLAKTRAAKEALKNGPELPRLERKRAPRPHQSRQRRDHSRGAGGRGGGGAGGGRGRPYYQRPASRARSNNNRWHGS